MRTIAFIGAGSHSDAVYAILDKNKYNLIGYFDDKDIKTYNNVPILGKINDIENILENSPIDNLFITIGDNRKRNTIFEYLRPKYYDKFINIISDFSIISSTAKIDSKGIFIGHNAVIGANVTIMDNVIINTSSIVEHHTLISKSCNITPGVILNGLISLNEGVYVGSKTVIIQLVQVASWSFIGAGSTVIKNLNTPNGLYLGTPAKFIRLLIDKEKK